MVNSQEFIFCLLATLRSNLILIPIKPDLTLHELKYILEDSKPDAVITTAEYLSRLENYFIQFKYIFVVGGPKTLKTYPVQVSFEELYEIGRLHHSHKSLTTKNSLVASINYTMIGKGIPLGAMLTHGNYVHAAIGYMKLLEIAPSIRLLLILPMYHVFGLMAGVIVPLIAGGTIILAGSLKPTAIFRDIERYGINCILGTPDIYMLLLEYFDAQKYDIGTLKWCISGGSYMSSKLYEEIKQKMNVEVLQGYGLTECFPIICNTRNNNVPGSLGIPGHKVRVKIEKKKGEQFGELMISSPTTMLGYYNQEKITSEVIKNGWFFTGDYAEIDSLTGHVMFRGLKKGIIKVRGNTVDLQEVYSTLMSHPAISGARFCIKDSATDSTFSAEIFVNTSAATAVSEENIRKFCSQRLANYKIPRITIIEGVARTHATI